MEGRHPGAHFGKIGLGGPAETGKLLPVLLSVTSFSLPFPEAGYPSSPAAVIGIFHASNHPLGLSNEEILSTIYYRRSLASKHLSLGFISDNT